VDDPIGSTWGYTSDMKVSGAGVILAKLIDTVSKNGVYMLNLSPRADGTFPQEQQNTLLEIGKWLDVNGEAIYATHNWTQFNDVGKLNVRFTVKGGNLYAIILGNWPGAEAKINSLSDTAGKISEVTMLGDGGELAFTQDETGLKVQLPASAPCKYAYVLKNTGLKMNPEVWTDSGNPIP
jgi:alpha-L-fucosidase